MGVRRAADAPPRRTPNRRGEGGRLRKDLVRAATELLDETGSTGAVTLRAVARQAGISAPSIYAHFANAEAILLAVVQEEFQRLREYLQAAVAEADGNAKTRLVAVCTGYLDYARARPERYLVLFGGIWNAAPAVQNSKVARADVAQMGQALLEDLTALLQACVDEELSTSIDPPMDATVLWLGLHGLAHQRITSTALAWPAGIEAKLINRLGYL